MRDIDAFPCASRCTAVTSLGYLHAHRRPVIRPAQIIALYGGALDNDRRISGRIPRVNSDGFTIAGVLPYLAFWPVALKTTAVGSIDSCTKCQA